VRNAETGLSKRITSEPPALDLPSFLIFKTGNFSLFPVQNADIPSFSNKVKPAGQVMFLIL
jgi:hypothetical protein